MITQAGARDEIFSQFKTAWDAGTPAIVGYIPRIEYQGKQPLVAPDISKYWCRLSLQAVSENQTAFARAQGEKKFTAFGLVYVQVFAPRCEINGFTNGLLLGQVGKLAFRGKSTPGGVWFYNVRVNELEPQDSFNRLNVVAEYEYDELG